MSTPFFEEAPLAMEAIRYRSAASVRLALPLFAFILIALARPAVGQQSSAEALLERLRNTPRDQIEIVDTRIAPPEFRCQLRVDDSGEIHHVHRPAIVEAGTFKSGQSSALTFNVTYTGFTTDFQNATQRALDTWAALLTATPPIDIDAELAPNPTPGVLASAGPTLIRLLRFSGTSCASQTDDCLWVGEPLAEALVATDIDPGVADINVDVNSNFTNWHTGAGPPSGSDFDLETVILHEVGHGLNFFKLFDYDDNGTPATTADDTATSLSTVAPFAGIFDILTVDALTAGDALTDTTVYPDGSNALALAIISESVYNDGTTAKLNNVNVRPKMYAPPTYASGSSISHLDEATFNGTLSALMTPAVAPGETARAPGSVTCGIMEDMLWTVDQLNCDVVMAAELVAFDAVVNNEDVILTWSTASETDNNGFYVQSKDAQSLDWNDVAFLTGAGSTTEAQQYEFVARGIDPGVHSFRLKAVDAFGVHTYSPLLEVAVTMTDAVRLTDAYPNPFNATATMSLSVARSQSVRADVYDVAGRRVSTLMNDFVQGQEPRPMTVDAGALPSGLYFVRVQGEDFVETRKLVLVR